MCFCNNNNNYSNIQRLTLTLSEIMQHNCPGFSSAAVTRAAFQGINSYQVPIYFTWVECGKCRSMSCQRTLVQRRDSNRGPCDRQSGDVSTRPQHLFIYCMLMYEMRYSLPWKNSDKIFQSNYLNWISNYSVDWLVLSLAPIVEYLLFMVQICGSKHACSSNVII